MFYVQGIQGQVFSAPLERLDRVNSLARARAVRSIDAAKDEIVVETTKSFQREEAVRAYRQMTPADLDRGPLYHADQIMSQPVVAAAPFTDIRRIASVMLDRGVDGMPVIAGTGRSMGFVSRSDILRAVVTAPPLSLWR